MIEVLQKSLSNTFSIIITVIVIGCVVGLFISWIYLPFAVFSIKKELKRIREIIEKNKISLD